jgi:hypothetical protein
MHTMFYCCARGGPLVFRSAPFIAHNVFLSTLPLFSLFWRIRQRL